MQKIYTLLQVNKNKKYYIYFLYLISISYFFISLIVFSGFIINKNNTNLFFYFVKLKETILKNIDILIIIFIYLKMVKKNRKKLFFLISIPIIVSRFISEANLINNFYGFGFLGGIYFCWFIQRLSESKYSNSKYFYPTSIILMVMNTALILSLVVVVSIIKTTFENSGFKNNFINGFFMNFNVWSSFDLFKGDNVSYYIIKKIAVNTAIAISIIWTSKKINKKIIAIVFINLISSFLGGDLPFYLLYYIFSPTLFVVDSICNGFIWLFIGTDINNINPGYSYFHDLKNINVWRVISISLIMFLLYNRIFYYSIKFFNLSTISNYKRRRIRNYKYSYYLKQILTSRKIIKISGGLKNIEYIKETKETLEIKVLKTEYINQKNKKLNIKYILDEKKIRLIGIDQKIIMNYLNKKQKNK